MPRKKPLSQSEKMFVNFLKEAQLSPRMIKPNDDPETAFVPPTVHEVFGEHLVKLKLKLVDILSDKPDQYMLDCFASPLGGSLKMNWRKFHLKWRDYYDKNRSKGAK